MFRRHTRNKKTHKKKRTHKCHVQLVQTHVVAYLPPSKQIHFAHLAPSVVRPQQYRLPHVFNIVSKTNKAQHEPDAGIQCKATGTARTHAQFAQNTHKKSYRFPYAPNV